MLDEYVNKSNRLNTWDNRDANELIATANEYRKTGAKNGIDFENKKREKSNEYGIDR